MDTVRLYSVAEKKLLLVTDRILSLTVEEDFTDAGRFEAVLPLAGLITAEPEMLVLTGGLWFVTEAVEIAPREGTQTLRGRGILSYLARCVIPEHTTHYRTAEDAILLFFHAFGAPALPGRYGVVLSGGGVSREHHASPGNLLGTVRAIARENGRGLKMDYDPAVNLFRFSVPAPRDRTVETGSSGVFLSTEGGTLLSPGTVTDLTDYKNYVLVRGRERGDGSLYTVAVCSEDCGFQDGFPDGDSLRREALLTPSVPLSSFYGEDGAFDEEAYLDALRVKGEGFLATHRPLRRTDGEVPAAIARDLSVGDVVSFSYEGERGQKLVAKKIYRNKDGRTDVEVTLTDVSAARAI